MYSYLKYILYDKLLKPRQSFWITLYKKTLELWGLYNSLVRQEILLLRILKTINPVFKLDDCRLLHTNAY